MAEHATSAHPAWLFATDGTQVIWSNAVGAAIFNAQSPADLSARRCNAQDPAAAQIARLAATLPHGGAGRLERLRGFGASFGRMQVCACSRIALADRSAILVVSTEPAGPNLPLIERVRRLLAGQDGALAAFTPEDTLLHASPAAAALMETRNSLASLGARSLAATALDAGRASGKSMVGNIAILRLGARASRVLLVSFPTSQPSEKSRPVEAPKAVETPVAPPRPQPPVLTDESAARGASDRPAEIAPPAELPAAREMPGERRHPLRFVWQMDAQGRFSLGSDEFTELIGPSIAVALGRPWSEIAAALGLDPQGEVARAVASRDTWSGVTVEWPVESAPERIAVELSGLPIYDRDRSFRGYRGFGVCRDVARISALMAARAAVPVAPAPAPPEAPKPETLQPSPTMPAAEISRSPIAEAPQSENILPFRPPGPDGTTGTLTPVERSAFAELARKLSDRINAKDEASPPAGREQAPPAGTAPASEDLAEKIAERDAAQDAGQDERPILERIPVGVLIYQGDHLLFANRAFLQWTGHGNLPAFAEAGGLDSLFIENKQKVGAGNGQSLMIETPGGEARATEARLFSVPWEGATAMVLVLVPALEEKSASKRAEAEIRELESILDTATDGVVVIDGEGRILAVNRSADALFGSRANELIGTAFEALFAPESKRTARDYLERLARDNVATVLNEGREAIGRVRQGGLIPLFMTMGRIAGGRQKFCAVFRDLTQWKKVEEELLAAKQQAERASAAKSEFLAKVSHEIRTPLNAIIGFSEVMKDERFGPVGNERYREYLKDIHSSGEHVISLINDLLDLSKIEAGKLDLSLSNVSLNDLTQQCVALMQPQANRERIIIRTSLPPALPPIVADARSVRQIVLNLLSNSIKFTGAGGQVIVSTALADDGHIMLRVRDTGAGMSEKEIAIALEPFRQLATATRPGATGTGLGLPLTKALAEANRASFAIKSAVNAGTLVEVAFPAGRVLAAE